MRNVSHSGSRVQSLIVRHCSALSGGLKLCGAVASIALLAGVAQVWAASDNPVPGDRVQSWAVGDIDPQPADTLAYANQTIREIVNTSVGGDQVRVRIANTF